MFTPIVVTDKDTGRKVHCTIFEAELFKSKFFTFDDLWEMYKDDITVQIMNNIYQPERNRKNRTSSVSFLLHGATIGQCRVFIRA